VFPAAWVLTIGLLLQTPAQSPPGATEGAGASAPSADARRAIDAARFPDNRPFTRIFQNLGHDVRTLPSTTSLAIFSVGAGSALAFRASDDDVSGWATRVGPSSYSRLGSVLGDAWTQVSGAAATYAIGRIGGNAELTHVGGDLLRAHALNGIITQGLKVTVDRTRPSGGHHSFPSGHTSASFVTASVLHGHYGWKAGAPAYATAVFIGWTRLRDNVHWVSDVIFGGTLGVMIGQSVTAGHRERAWTIVPARTSGGAAIYFVRTPGSSK
jgi:membrane-associated phospholipid phosphatase